MAFAASEVVINGRASATASACASTAPRAWPKGLRLAQHDETLYPGRRDDEGVLVPRGRRKPMRSVQPNRSAPP